MFLKADDEKFVREFFTKLTEPVKISYFTQNLECQYCRETRQLLEEVVALSDKIKLEVYNFQTDKALADSLGIDKIPATVISPEKNSHARVKFYGIPAGYEFTSLLEAILMASTGQIELEPDLQKIVAAIDRPVHIQVFVTPTCPYCPSAVQAAQKLAFLNPNIRAEMVESIEFPHLANRYSVRGVPRTVINENWSLEGAVPEQMLVAKIQESLRSVA